MSGNWVMGNNLPSITEIEAPLDTTPKIKGIQFNTEMLNQWDSRLLNFLGKIIKICDTRSIGVDQSGIPAGPRTLLQLAQAIPERKEVRRTNSPHSMRSRIRTRLQKISQETKQMVDFVGETFLVLIRFFRGKAHYRTSDLGLMLEECGPSALPIITLISILVGLILAFIGAVQLRMLGAQIFVANLVGLGMTREMGAMMSAVIMAGRTGAAFAAQLGAMQVNDEIDALRTMGISPMEFLVLPRLLALILMLPLLCLYADFMGILGGFIVGVGLLDLSLTEYFYQTKAAMGMNDFAVGLIKSVIFGILVALSGCLRGMQCGRSSAAVGAAATSAMVTAIVAIVVADAIMTLVYDAIGL